MQCNRNTCVTAERSLPCLFARQPVSDFLLLSMTVGLAWWGWCVLGSGGAEGGGVAS